MAGTRREAQDALWHRRLRGDAGDGLLWLGARSPGSRRGPHHCPRRSV